MAARLVNFLFVRELIEENGVQDDGFVMRVERRHLRDFFNPFDISDIYFRHLYRLPKQAVHELIASLAPHLRPCRRSSSIPIWMRVTTTLDFLASGSYQRRVGQGFLNSMSQTSVSAAINEVVLAMSDRLLGQWVKFPNTEEEFLAMKQRFMVTQRFPGVIGIVDGTHIAISPPTKEREHLFLNRKGYHSKNVQVICDPDMRILALNARHGGRSHDSHIWRISGIRQQLATHYAQGRRGFWLLGDSGYPSEPWLLRPVENHPPAATPEGRYNERFCSTRSTVERCIGILKAKFRCCLKDRTLHYSPEIAGRIINACAVVHNIGVQHRVPNPPGEFDEIDLLPNAVMIDDPAPQQPAGPLNVFAVGQAVRARVIRDHFAV